MDNATAHLEHAIQLAYDNVRAHGGRPFGAVLTRDGEVIAAGVNTFMATGDPTAHAELEALRAAGREGAFNKPGEFVMYASGNPCPMCQAAMTLLGVDAVYYAYSNAEGEEYGLSTADIEEELAKPASARRMKFVHERVRVDGADPYQAWRDLTAK